MYWLGFMLLIRISARRTTVRPHKFFPPVFINLVVNPHHPSTPKINSVEGRLFGMITYTVVVFVYIFMKIWDCTVHFLFFIPRILPDGSANWFRFNCSLGSLILFLESWPASGIKIHPKVQMHNKRQRERKQQARKSVLSRRLSSGLLRRAVW
jgi:hypothetical protein